MRFSNYQLSASNVNLTTQVTNAYKKYVDESHMTPSGHPMDAFRYLMIGESTSMSRGLLISVSLLTRSIKKAYEFTMTKDDDGVNYRSRISFNLGPLRLLYTCSRILSSRDDQRQCDSADYNHFNQQSDNQNVCSNGRLHKNPHSVSSVEQYSTPSHPPGSAWIQT